MAVGGRSWRPEAESPPNPLQIAAPPISGRLQVSASFLPCCVVLCCVLCCVLCLREQERTSLDLPGLSCTLGLQATACGTPTYC